MTHTPDLTPGVGVTGGFDDEQLDALDPQRSPTADELTLLTGFLDYYRAVLTRKASGLDRAQLATTIVPSTLSLGGLLKHLTKVEDVWFSVRFGDRPIPEPFADVDWNADPDWDWHSAADDSPADLHSWFAAACDRSRQVVAEVGDLDAVTVVPNRRGIIFSLRWVLVHLIDEYARHAGHADLLRETIDGATGD